MPAASSVVTRVVKRGEEDRFRRWCDEVAEDARAASGHREELRFEQTGGLFHLLHRFASREELRGWQASAGYARLMDAGDAFSTPREQQVDDHRAFVQLPSEADGPKWKRFVMTWLAVLPVIILLNLGFEALPAKLPGPLQSALASFIMVAAMTWLILPRVSRRVKPWVLKDGNGEAPLD